MSSQDDDYFDWVGDLGLLQIEEDVAANLKSKKASVSIKPKKSEAEDGFQCEHCNLILTNRDVYQKHLNNHKKRVKKKKQLKKQIKQVRLKSNQGKFGLQSLFGNDEVTAQDNQRKFGLKSLSDASTLEGLPEEKNVFTRKKYRMRNEPLAVRLLESYVYSIVPYLCLRLALDPNTVDFDISVNDKRWHTYGDIVINLLYKDKRTKYAIRCKNVSDIPQTIDSLKDARITLEKEYDAIYCCKNQKDFAITKFLLFTTCIMSSRFPHLVNLNADSMNTQIKIKDEVISNINIKVIGNKKKDVINISSDNENIFLLSPDIEIPDFPPLFLYTNQRSPTHTMLDELIKKKFAVDRSFFKSFKNYIESWSEGNMGGNYYLSKKDIILKLGELLLEPYINLPRLINFKTRNFEIWNKVVKETDVIIIANEPYIFSKLCEPFNQTIEETLSLCTKDTKEKVSIDTITKMVVLNNDMINEMKDHEVKAYLFEEDFNIGKSEIHLSKLYNVFWKAGRIPLLISLENHEDAKDFVMNVISYMKKENVRKKFMIKSKVPHLFRNIPDNLKFFICLEDVEDCVNLEDIKIRISSDFSLSVKHISETDPFILKWITPSIFFDMISNSLSIKREESLKMNTASELKIILDEETKEKVRAALYEDGPVSENFGRLSGIDPKLF